MVKVRELHSAARRAVVTGQMGTQESIAIALSALGAVVDVALAEVEEWEARLAEAEYQQKVHKTFGEEQFALREAAEAERDEAQKRALGLWRSMTPEQQDVLIAEGWHP
jgi:hypothetical protein